MATEKKSADIPEVTEKGLEKKVETQVDKEEKPGLTRRFFGGVWKVLTYDLFSFLDDE